ncbi:MAG: DUF748 domain-containing protein [Chthoniobacterales bacterium]
MKAAWKKPWVWLLVVIATVVVVVHLYLAIWVRDYVNRKLSEIEGYRAHVDAVTLHLWRGAYQIHHIKIQKVEGHVPVPFFEAPLVDLSVEWEALFHGALVGQIDMYRPEMNFVNSASKANSQVGVDKPWTDKIRQLFPVKINRFSVKGGTIHYRDYSKSPRVDVPVDDVRMVATNLTNSKKLSKTLHAHVEIEGRPLREGDARAKIDLDPYAAKPTFSTQIEVKGIELVKLNEFAKAYAGITFETGTLRVATELDSKSGRFKGYIEPVFDHMSIFNPAHDMQNPLNGVWQAIVGGLTRIVRNHPQDRFGTRVPLAGSFDDPSPDVMTTVFNVFRNAFIKAFTGTLNEEGVKVPQTDPDKH